MHWRSRIIPPPDIFNASVAEETSTLDIKSYHSDTRLIHKELLLNSAVRNDPHLTLIADVNQFKGRGERLYALGSAVTVIANRGEECDAKQKANAICAQFSRKKSVDIKLDHAINMRGLAFIQQCLATETLLDATHYALGLRIGADMRENILDAKFIREFAAIWQQRLDLAPC
ncbi:hypothetical protein ACQYRI_20040 [Salmonella enterica]